MTFQNKAIAKCRQVRHWCNNYTNRAYKNPDQGIGKQFVPGELKGYFNDLTGKLVWKCSRDENSVPFMMLDAKYRHYFPIMISQQCLGHWDAYLLAGSGTARQADVQKDRFLRLTDWLLKNQDAKGGWDCWSKLKARPDHRYSAMAQGQAISVFARAYHLTSDQKYYEAAFRAFELMKVPVTQGGVTNYEGERVYLEEAPLSRKETILNGWIFSIFGLYDLTLIDSDAQVKDLYKRAVATLKMTLESYDCRFWTYYDLAGRYASPFYHKLHIAQMQALDRLFPKTVFGEFCLQWKRYYANPVSRSLAFVLKAGQKLCESTEMQAVR